MASSATAKKKPKPKVETDADPLRPAFITLPIVIAVHRDRERGRYYAAHYEAMRNVDLRHMEVRGPDRTTRDYELYTIRMRVRPEAVTGVSQEEGPDGAIVFINGVQYTCRMSAKAIYELIL